MTQLTGKIHKRLYMRGSEVKDSYGRGEAMCSSDIPTRQLRRSWLRVTCKLCLRHKPKAEKRRRRR